MMNPIRVAIVEDDAGFRKSLAGVLLARREFALAGEFATGGDAVKGCTHAAPDVVLMDLNLPDLPGEKVTERIKELLPEVNVVVLTVYNDTEHIFKALRAGASGYLLKRSSAGDIVRAVREAHEGGGPMTPEIARKVLLTFAPAEPARKTPVTLAPREVEILELVAEGFTNKEIAAKLSLTPKTVTWYLHEIYRKLHVQGRIQAVNKFFQGQDQPDAEMPGTEH